MAQRLFVFLVTLVLVTAQSYAQTPPPPPSDADILAQRYHVVEEMNKLDNLIIQRLTETVENYGAQAKANLADPAATAKWWADYAAQKLSQTGTKP